MQEEQHPIKSWAQRLSGEGEPLTMPEAQLLASISLADRTFEMLTVLQDIQARLTRMEVFLANNVPGYDADVRNTLYRAIAEAEAASLGRR